ncbi:parallel beta-helix repeat protein [Azospirillum sp. OGB3]|uniref:right-handed parallel beta-helix repeat-containing protein n=1 Tax=Azospirillum sp. OGB3 TaxID=2587012 RepID=UPI001840087A|nr:right-handed parallel beta-helix repeat-containing protein [Azospirillum sp. OGB3]MBB3264548.1 parallel beta-helix repeat protein [Azospirillum sp. OGB3]
MNTGSACRRHAPRPARLAVAVLLAGLPTTALAAEPATVALRPGTDIQAVVDRHPAGTRFRLEAGVHRLQSIVPKNDTLFEGAPGAVLSGARRLTAFVRRGSVWVARGQTQEGRVNAAEFCRSGFPRCARPEDLFIDDTPMRHVGSRSAVGPGRWFFDYDADEILIGDDPAGRTVETSVTPRAFGGTASGVVIRNLTIEKYAAPIQAAAVDAEFGPGWTVRNNVLRLNHGVGVNAGNGSRILDNRILDNGHAGFSGSGTDFLIAGNEIARNGYAGVDFHWEGGGGKVTESDGGLIRSNCVHDNVGAGIWADIDVRRLVIEDNLVFGNADNGITYEISYDGVIRNNRVADNGQRGQGWFWGAQILISSARGVKVYGNDIDVPNGYGNAVTVVSQDRAPYTPAVGNEIFDNRIVIRNADARVGAVTDVDTDNAVVAAGNRLFGNRYHLADLTERVWFWNDAEADWNAIRAQGQETGSIAHTDIPQKTPLSCPSVPPTMDAR